MTRKFKWVIGALATIVLATGIGLVFGLNTDASDNQEESDKSSKQNDKQEKKADNDNEQQEEKSDKDNEQQESNPFGNHISARQANVADVLKYIHYMSHQKVRAEKKWGFYEITDERIEWLSEAVKGISRQGEELREIVNRWQNDNFSKIDKDHNIVWDILGGTDEDEKATGILNDEEEQKYIENTKELSEKY